MGMPNELYFKLTPLPSGVAVTFTSDLILHHTGEWKERAYKCHEMWPTVQMWMHAGAQPKSAELPDGAT